ncbi:MAG: cupin domain-containing protein, partial [Burkholderiales bacterium]|nr:cupin domain-containing protein [Burkholderiales bacterium]
QCGGGPRTESRSGDVAWCPCRKRHWHGASIATAMSLVAITEMIDGKNVEWMKPVSDEHYQGGPLITD